MSGSLYPIVLFTVTEHYSVRIVYLERTCTEKLCSQINSLRKVKIN